MSLSIVSVYEEAPFPLRCEALTPTMFATQSTVTEYVVQIHDTDEPPLLMDTVSWS